MATDKNAIDLKLKHISPNFFFHTHVITVYNNQYLNLVQLWFNQINDWGTSKQSMFYILIYLL